MPSSPLSIDSWPVTRFASVDNTTLDVLSYFTLMFTFTSLYFVPQHMRVAVEGAVCAKLRRQVRET